jgi:hypothetical protein
VDGAKGKNLGCISVGAPKNRHQIVRHAAHSKFKEGTSLCARLVYC